MSDSQRPPWTAAFQAPPSMGFSRQEDWSGVPSPSRWKRTEWNRGQVHRHQMGAERVPLCYSSAGCYIVTSSLLGEGNGTPLQYSCLENPMDGGASPWGRLQSMGLLRVGTTERLHFPFSLSCTGEGNGNPLQCSCLENPRDGGAWWAAIYGVAQSRTRLQRLAAAAAGCKTDPWFVCYVLSRF